MRRSDSGKGQIKGIFALAFLAALAFVLFKTVPVYVSNYEFQDFLRGLAVRATVEHATAEAIRNQVVAKAQDLNLPVRPDDVQVQAGNKVTIDVDYKVPVDLKVYTLSLHFTPSAVNRSI